MENETFDRTFFETLERSIETLPQAEREKLYRPCAEKCVQSYVLGEMRRQFDECGGDLDRQYETYGRSEFFFADIVERGRVYELGYPRCLCPLTTDGFACPAGHCECSRQSILCVLETLLPGRAIQVELLHTVLTGAKECRFRVTVGKA
jgi:hypothetical protein